VVPLAPSTTHALLMDWTHDNPSPVEKRPVQDMLPSAALVAMAACAVGSNCGYDELVPRHIHVVTEQRPYAGWAAVEQQALARLHARLAAEGFTELFVDQVNRDVVCVTRHCPRDLGETSFRQRDAGKMIDKHMKDAGFNIEFLLVTSGEHRLKYPFK
jgi:glycogen debranching enzyme